MFCHESMMFHKFAMDPTQMDCSQGSQWEWHEIVMTTVQDYVPPDKDPWRFF